MDMLVDADDAGMIATSNAGDVANEDIALAGEPQLQRFTQLPCSVQVTGHIVADTYVGAGQGLQTEVREEAGYGVDIFDMKASAAGYDLKLGW